VAAPAAASSTTQPMSHAAGVADTWTPAAKVPGE